MWLPAYFSLFLHLLVGILALRELTQSTAGYQLTLRDWLTIAWTTASWDLIVWGLSLLAPHYKDRAARPRWFLHHSTASMLLAVLLTALTMFVSAADERLFNASRYTPTFMDNVDARVPEWFRNAMLLPLIGLPYAVDFATVAETRPESSVAPG